MKVLVVLAAVACLTQSALSYWVPYKEPYAYGGYHGPLAKPEVDAKGFLKDTPEVAHAKAAHLSEVAKVSSYIVAEPAKGYEGGYAAGYTGGYHGPLAKIVVNEHGFVEDTPEVAHAKAAHLKLAGGAGYAGGYSGEYAGSYDDGSYKGEGAYDDGSYKGEGAYAPAAPVAPVAPWAGHYDDGSYKGEGKYDGKYGYASVGYAESYEGAGEDDGSYKPHLYEKKGYY